MKPKTRKSTNPPASTTAWGAAGGSNEKQTHLRLPCLKNQPLHVMRLSRNIIIRVPNTHILDTYLVSDSPRRRRVNHPIRSSVFNVFFLFTTRDRHIGSVIISWLSRDTVSNASKTLLHKNKSCHDSFTRILFFHLYFYQPAIAKDAHLISHEVTISYLQLLATNSSECH